MKKEITTGISTKCLNDSDTWFINNLICLLDSEVAIVNKKLDTRINGGRIQEWIKQYSNSNAPAPSPPPIQSTNIVGEDMICPITKVQCDDECCTVGSECNVSGDEISDCSPPIQSIDEAAFNYDYNSLLKNGTEWVNHDSNKIMEAFKAGAEHQARQQPDLLEVINRLQEQYDENGYDCSPVIKLQRIEQCIDSALKFWKDRQQPVSADILGIYDAWPLVDVLRKLTEMTKLLLDRYNYDQTGWEDVSHCVKRGEEIIKLLESGKVQQPVRKTLDDGSLLDAKNQYAVNMGYSDWQHWLSDKQPFLNNVIDNIFKLYASQSEQGWVSEFDKARFWSNCNIGKKCWTWKGGFNSDGYGTFRIGKNVYLAHRLAYSLIHSVGIFDEHHVCHRCDNPSCINPDHLFAGTHKDNMIDLHQKYRGRKSLSSSKYVGVTFRTDSNNWRAITKVGGKYKSLGSFKNEEDAAKAYDQKMIEIHGYEAVKNNLNIPLPEPPTQTNN